MKVSIAWIFDYIDADWRTIDVAHLVSRFNQVTAEIECFEKISIDLDQLSMVRIAKIEGDKVTAHSAEWKKDFELPSRKNIELNQVYLVKDNGKTVSWALAHDVGSGKDSIVPVLDCPEELLAGGWKKHFENDDYIMEVDNKSITHRPDLWGHRGLAREVAAILNLPFKDLDPLLAHKKVTEYDKSVPATASNPIAIELRNSEVIKRFSGIYLNNVAIKPCSLPMAFRLMRVDVRAIDALVDITNYVMLELSQPMHAFDASAIKTKKLVPQLARKGEKITLLDGDTVELTSEDIIISDGTTPLSLAGVMGGKESGINANTTAILLEAASFDAPTIRRTATRFKKRSEASARFEKSLDLNQDVLALQRFLKLFAESGMKADQSDEIFSLGKAAQELKITITHEFIEKRLGVSVSEDQITAILEKIDFGVELRDGVYTISVPTYRCSKDIKIKEDIVEEIGRFYGYGNLQPQLPLMQVYPKNLQWIYRRRKAKELLAYGLGMRELYNYAFFDEEFLNQLNWQPGQTLEVQSPVSDNWRRLVTTLVPGLLKAAVSNAAEHEKLRFFEVARTWEHKQEVIERGSMAGIFFDKKNPIDFYEAKAELQLLFDAFEYTFEWKKIERPDFPWYAPYQTAALYHNGIYVGIVGKLHPTFMSNLCAGDAFIFELDANFFMHHKDALKRYKPTSKYPEMVRDISMLIERSMSAEHIIEIIGQCDPKIVLVELLDFFEKDEWPDKRSMTFRFTISDKEKTMTKEEADVIWEAVAATLKQHGAQIR